MSWPLPAKWQDRAIFGIDADSRSSLTPSEWLPESSDTLVTRLSTTIAIGAERSMLIAWVANGGHLVLLPPHQESRIVSEFQDHLGFRLVEVETDNTDDEDQGDSDSESFAYSVDLEHTRYRIELHEADTVGTSLSDAKGVVAARREWGSGYVTVIANSRYFANRSIDDSDHARFLLDAVAGYVEPGKVWFIYDATFASLWQVIWKNAPYVVISLAVVLAFWLWSIMPMYLEFARGGPAT